MGTYKVYCKVKDNNGNTIWKTIDYVIELGDTLKINKVTTSASSPQSVGSSIKFTINATGAKQYGFIIKDASGKNTTLKSYSSSNTAIWKPTKAGTYSIYCKVKDAYGNIVFKKVNFVITK